MAVKHIVNYRRRSWRACRGGASCRARTLGYSSFRAIAVSPSLSRTPFPSQKGSDLLSGWRNRPTSTSRILLPLTTRSPVVGAPVERRQSCGVKHDIGNAGRIFRVDDDEIGRAHV